MLMCNLAALLLANCSHGILSYQTTAEIPQDVLQVCNLGFATALIGSETRVGLQLSLAFAISTVLLSVNGSTAYQA